MPFTAVASADWHFGGSRRLKGYLERQMLMVDKVARIAERKTETGVIMVSADVFDREHVLAKERDAFLSKIMHYDAQGLTFVITDGNHDRLSRTHSNLTFLKILAKFGAFRNLKIAVINPEKFRVQGVDILAVPWTGWSQKQYNARLLKYLRDFDCDEPIVMTHEQFRGCPDDKGWQTDEGPKPNKKLMAEARMVIAGHVHKRQRIRDCAFYTGAPMQKTFGEDQDKGVLVVNYSKPNRPKYVPIKGIKPLVTLTEIPEDGEWPDAYIKLKLPKHTPIGALPEDVVYNVYDSADLADTPSRKVDLSNPLDGLRELLIEVGLPKRLLNKALEYAEDIYNASQSLH